MIPNPEYEAIQRQRLQARAARSADAAVAQLLAAARLARQSLWRLCLSLVRWIEAYPTLAIYIAGGLSIVLFAFLLYRLPADVDHEKSA